MNDLVRRFYKTSAVADDDAGVVLDERRLKTPRGAVFSAPSPAMAQAIAEEWGAQGERIVPSSMPLTQLAFAAIDVTPSRRDELADYIAKFGETDLLCHRAASPPMLVTRQTMLWDPLVAWSARELGVILPVVVGVTPAPTNAEALETLRAHAAALDDFQLTALAQAAGAAGSALVAFAMLHGRLTGESAFNAAALDTLYSLETWGEDAEARARLDSLRAEFENIARFISVLG
ncbi:MAG: ATPase [Hyphomonadaceae bacterium]|nr:ATPase [Hyphomonadaceae bacterium]